MKSINLSRKLNARRQTRAFPKLHRLIVAMAPATALSMWLSAASAAPAPSHNIVAANIDVTINDLGNTTGSVTLTTPYVIGDFRVPYGNNGDYDVQIGQERTNDVLDGILMTSIRENGRDDGNFVYSGTQFCNSFIDYHRPGATNDSGELVENSYWIPLAATKPNSLGTSVLEWDANVAAAWFPYTNYIGGFARNSTGQNGGALDLFTGSPGLVLGTNFKDLSGGKAIVDLHSFGIDARTNGVLLVEGAKNEDNYGLSQVNTVDGTWNVWSKDNGTDGSSSEQDPLAFVFIPNSDTNVISGRFQGDGTILMHNGDSPKFSVTPIDTGEWKLQLTDTSASPRFGVLLVSPEGGMPGNQDNIVNYQLTDAADGWIIQSRDLPSSTNSDQSFNPPPLETPGGGSEPICDFVFIPGATAGFVVTPTNNLYTTENGDSTQFSVVLQAPPTNDVTIAVSSDDTTEGTVSPTSLTFTPDNWNTSQYVTVTGVDDAEADGPITYHVNLTTTSSDTSYSGLNPGNVTVVNLDNETRFTVVPIAGLTTTEAGGTATFTVQLNTAPTSDVTVGLSSSDTSEGTVSPSSLTFTPSNWSQPQTVTATGVDDFVQDGNVAYTIITAPAVSSDSNYNGQNPPDVSAINLDNDVAAVNLSVNSLNVLEGHTATYTVALNSQPISDVTVTLTSSDTTQGGTISPATLTFNDSNWNTPQTVTVTGTDDLVADGNTAWTITNSITSSDANFSTLAPLEVAVTTLDNEPMLTLPSGSTVYGLGMPAVGIDSRGLIADPNVPNENGTKLTMTLTANSNANDLLEIRNTGTDSGQIGVSGSNVSYGGTTIASFTGGNGPTPLVVTFNNASTPESAQALLRNVTFRTTGTNESRRTLTAVLAHADGGTSQAMTSIRVGLLRMADFQDGADGGYGVYNNQVDTELYESFNDLPFPAGHTISTSDPVMWVDARSANTPEEAQVLMRFDNIIGDQLGQIPANATIVSAELILNVENQGDGSPLFRMLVPWDENSATWNSMGGGIHPDGITAETNYDSQIGVKEITGSTGAGPIIIGVTADIQAWVDGQTNYGWGMCSWDQDLNSDWSRGTDGMGFSPSETPNTDNRPRLRVLWIPNDTPVASFRQGVNDYTNAYDTTIDEDKPDADNSASTSLDLDYAGDHVETLIRFDDLVGYDTKQIPPGAHIEAAMLDLATLGGNAYGDGGQFFQMLTAWNDTNTWNSIGGGIQTDDVQASSTPSFSAGSPELKPNVCGGYMSFDVTADVQNWANGTANYGWAGIPWVGGSDGWDFGSAEETAERDRPRLRVFYTYTPPAVTLVLSTNQINVVEGQRANYTVALSAQPSANVVVSVVSGDTAHGGTVAPLSLTFTPSDWNTPQTVTIAAADDLIPDGNVSWAVTNMDDTVPTMLVSVNTLDNEAVLTLPSGGTTYGIGTPAVGIAGGATIVDPNTTDYSGTTLTIALTANGATDDRLEIRNTGTASGQIGVSGSTVSYNGINIGTFNGGSGTTPLAIVFNASATSEAAQALLRNVTFRNVNSGIPSLATRSVGVTLAHADGGTSSASTTINVGMIRASDFQEGADGGYGVYGGESDIQLSEADPDTAYPAGSSGTSDSPNMWIDARSDSATLNEQQVLLRFNDIIGNGPGQIPANAVIVSAELTLNVVNTGHGSPLFRMLIPWDATNETWNSFGDGIQADGIEAETNWDSEIGETAAAGTTGSGEITVGVTADVQAWANGQANYGWGMTSWDPDINANWSRGDNAVAFNPGETPDVSLRPHLRVLWVTNGTAMLSFRQGVNGYTNAADTRIRERSTNGDNTNDFSTLNSFFVDWAVSSGGENDEQVLMRFDDIVGTNADQIPPGAHIEYAVLDLSSTFQNACGDGGQFFAMLEPWQDTNSWVSLNGGIQADGVKAALAPTVSAGSPSGDPNVCGGYMSFDVTSDVQNWANGTVNYGWAILPWNNGGDGWGISSAEATAERDRPRLRVYYDTSVISPASIVLKTPVINSGSVAISFTGSSGSYTVWRAATLNGPWTNVGSVNVGTDGVGAFTDNSPLAGGAFYRVSNP